jgi:hypothetical protein
MTDFKLNRIKEVNKGDFLAFKASDNRYKVIFCTSTNKDRSHHSYKFAATSYDSDLKPSIKDIIPSYFYGIGIRKNSDYKPYTDEQLERMWQFHPNIKPYCLYSYSILIFRKEFFKMRDSFLYLGNLSVAYNLDTNGSAVFYPGTIDFLDKFFTKNLQNEMADKGQRKFLIQSILDGLG